MLQKILHIPNENMLPQLDATDGLAAAIIHYYQSLVKHLRWRDLGCVFAKGVAAVGDIQGNPALDQAKALGAALK